ncbi:hypothetical protein TSAR_003367 [Trichomalopsis sarcophagae]|uniref:Uncharacterized protein n=1 Tax=Trichomalopsis sarcophagae TaxID=543379 RepID=A0A232ED87_9HYME|nr:hypothetical protein TSAR_003367 [Trichomalopsis sarcophagae]
MEHDRKMIVVPETMAERLQNTQHTTVQHQQHAIPTPPTTEGSVQTPGDNLSRLDAEMHEILNSKKFISEEEKSDEKVTGLQDSRRQEDREGLVRKKAWCRVKVKKLV